MAHRLTAEELKEKKKLFLEALEESRGMLTTSCERIGIDRGRLIKWREKDKDFDEAINRIKDKQKEWVQGKLMTAIENGNVVACMFFLKTQCGWRETNRLEVENVNDVDVSEAIKELKKSILKNEKE